MPANGGSGRHRPLLRRLFSRLGRNEVTTDDDDVRRLEEKQRSLQRATEQWLSLLREMEQEGESNELNYDRYYQAYLDAKRQQKHVEMLLFNMRNQQKAS